MIGDWIKYITDTLASAVRGSVLVQLISTLLSPSKTAQDSLNAYLSDARLRSAATWQTCWLELLLSDNLGYTVTITEASGLPVDFVVTGVSYTDAARASALLNRYKLAGRSYILEFGDVAVTAQWGDALCEQTALINITAQWSDALCELSTSVLRVIDDTGNLRASIPYLASGETAEVNTYYVIHASDVTVTQINASIGGLPVEVNNEASITIVSIVDDITNRLMIEVAVNTTSEYRQWTFRLSTINESFYLTINQLA